MDFSLPKYNRPVFLLWIVSCLAIAILTVSNTAAEEIWVEDSFDDFNDGHLDASGQNLYVAADGTVRTIHRFDLNEDGYIDLLFNNSHDYWYHIPATAAWLGPNGQVQHGELAVEGSIHATVSDFNCDGYKDIAFCPNQDEIHPRRLITILYGGPDGWSNRHSSGFVCGFYAERIVSLDLNADGWPDLALLNVEAWEPDQPKGNVIRIFWGSPDGFIESEKIDLGVPKAVDMVAMHLDAQDSLAVLSGEGIIYLFHTQKADTNSTLDENPTTIQPECLTLWEKSIESNPKPLCMAASDVDNDGKPDMLIGSEDGLFLIRSQKENCWAKPECFPSIKASQIVSGDLDQDGLVDLALVYSTTATAVGGQVLGSGDLSANFIKILWGSHKENKSKVFYSEDDSTTIPLSHPCSVAIGDLNADGIPDLAVAIRHDEEDFSTNSLILLGTGKREFKATSGDIPTIGAEYVAIITAHKELPAHAVFCNRVGGQLGEIVNPRIYWGTSNGFAMQHSTIIPKVSAYEATAADLNLDGRIDLVLPLFGHSMAASAANPLVGGTIYWGTNDGFDFSSKRTVLREGFLITSNAADLNRDGYLDLIFGQSKVDSAEKEEQLIIHYGSPSGIDGSTRTTIPSPGRSVSSVIADFNRDEWLDIAVNSRMEDKIRIFWGGPSGFSEKHQHVMRVYNPVDLETADLNQDGYLDLIVSTLDGRLLHLKEIGTMILWGGPDGFNTTNSQRVPSFMSLGQCVADFDADGYLDLVSPAYTGGNTRESNPSYLYWGGPDGFSPQQRTIFECDAAAAAFAADFDRDGRLDLVIATHRDGHSHRSVSRVFYNDGNRFQNSPVTTLPTEGPHWFWQNDMGHIYDRSYRQQYTSSVYSLQNPKNRAKFNFKATSPEGTKLTFSIRKATSPEQLAVQPWQPLKENGFAIIPTDRVIQYQATFTSDNGDRYPILDRVEIRFE